QPPSRPPSVDSLIADDQTNPGADDLRISQIDVFANQSRCALALCVDEPFARAIVPVEQDVDAVFRSPQFRSALFPFVRGISRDWRICAAIPAAVPMSFERIVLNALARRRPGPCVVVVRGSRETSDGRELYNLLIVGIGDVHDPKWISRSAALLNSTFMVP